jgi:cytosine/adenosine deaminase-related metal-dependent hydrolase
MSTVYHGAVINPQTLTSYDALPNCLLAVSPAGEIEWIVEDVVDSMVQETMSQKGCLEAELISLKHGEFIIPGLIDTHTVSSQRWILALQNGSQVTHSMHLKSRTWGCRFQICIYLLMIPETILQWGAIPTP